MYSELCKAYRCMPTDLAMQTPMQLLALYNPQQIADILYFDTEEEYVRWATSRL